MASRRAVEGAPRRPALPRQVPALSKSTVLEAAIDHVDRFGVAALSMRCRCASWAPPRRWRATNGRGPRLPDALRGQPRHHPAQLTTLRS